MLNFRFFRYYRLIQTTWWIVICNAHIVFFFKFEMFRFNGSMLDNFCCLIRHACKLMLLSDLVKDSQKIFGLIFTLILNLNIFTLFSRQNIFTLFLSLNIITFLSLNIFTSSDLFFVSQQSWC